MQQFDLWGPSPIDDSLNSDKRVIIVGGGKMGTAILDGLIPLFEPGSLAVVEPDDARRTELRMRYPELSDLSSLSQIEDQTYGVDDWIILAVKPQVMGDVLDEINRIGCQATVISIAVGVSIAQLQSALPLATVIRMMPNLPVMVGEGMLLLAPSDTATQDQVDEVAEACFELGDIALIEEKDIDICAAISGSGPAYFALIVDALESAGIEAGLPPSLARDLAVVTMIGTGDMLEVTGEEPTALARAVQSPGGTTEQAVAILEDRGLKEMLAAAVQAAIERAAQLRDGT
jgi:pyrroline-5-carboxylate reductase